MLTVLKNPSYARLFSAQIVALLGTGLLTIALGLLAFEIAGGDAGLVMGVAMTVKMVAYVAVAPVVSAWLSSVPRKRVLIGADIVRALIALGLPFVTEAWQIYVLIFVLQSASATFTPAFQAVIPSVLPDEAEYTRALTLSRLAYDLESLVSPMLAAILLTVISYHNLFMGTVFGFIGSAILVLLTRFPAIAAPAASRFLERLTSGVRAFWQAPELRALMGLNLVAATTTAMVIVNTVVLVKGDLARTQSDVALLLGAYGAGSMLIALLIPRLLDRVSDKPAMLAGAVALPVLLLIAAGVMGADALSQDAQWWVLLVLWLLTGAATSLILTPSSRLLRRNSTEENRPAVFAAQFSLSHACYLITYPLAGVVGVALGLANVALILALIGVVGVLVAFVAWNDPQMMSRTNS
ncbi:MFS transporter [Neomicrococcus lactis]|uniref:MFS family permease n=1 Tax=Neomicrococcus lactis TaxID=732241 RepID=A0A7W8YBT1_9MICC|nr:MFS transporter [Neomicrococcus lactis]MBB5598643.1 MFS family permease [Neomicrococcus lactis]